MNLKTFSPKGLVLVRVLSEAVLVTDFEYENEYADEYDFSKR